MAKKWIRGYGMMPTKGGRAKKSGIKYKMGKKSEQYFGFGQVWYWRKK